MNIIGEPIRHELLPMTWALMDIALLTPLSLALLRWTRYWPPGQVLLLLLLLMLLPFNLVRLFSLLQLPKKQQQRLLTLTLVVVLFIALRTLLHNAPPLLDFSWLADFYASLSRSRNNLWVRDVSLFGLVVFVWWRGIQLVGRQPDISRIGLKLRVGGLILAPLIIWLGNNRLLWSSAPYILLFFLAGLTAVALIRAEQVEFEQTGLGASLSGRWLGSIFLASLLVVLTAGTLAAIVSGSAAFLILGWLSPLWQAFYLLGTVALAGFSYVAFPFFWLMGTVLELLSSLLALILAPLLARWFNNPQPQPLGEIPPILTLDDLVTVTNQLHPAAKLALFLIPLGIILLISLALNRLYRQATLANGRRQQSQRLDETEADADLGLGQRLLRRLGLWRNWQTAVSIRRIYQQMCRAASGAGYPRGESTTPFEYLTLLAQVWPNNQADSHLITQAFVRIRYGEFPETRAELDEIRRAWERLEHTPPISLADSQATLPYIEAKL